MHHPAIASYKEKTAKPRIIQLVNHHAKKKSKAARAPRIRRSDVPMFLFMQTSLK
jgi:hypothetical protein